MNKSKPFVRCSPHNTDLFVVGGEDLRLYETRYVTNNTADVCLSYHKRQCHVVDVNSDLPQLKAFDWFPNDSNPLFYAACLGSGKLIVTQFENQSITNHHERLQAHEFVPKYSRPCNSVAWNPINPNQIAVGLEKVRNDFCTIVWDIEYTGRSLYGTQGAYELPNRPSISNLENSTTKNPLKIVSTSTLSSNLLSVHTPTQRSRNRMSKPAYELANSEATTALAWVPGQPQCLATGTGFKWLRIYDLRESSSTPMSVVAQSRSVLGVVFDPLRPNYLATYSDAAYEPAKVWDLRKLNGSTGPIVAMQPVTKQISDMAWSPRQPGILATTCLDEKWVSLWNVATGDVDIVESGKREPVTVTVKKPFQRRFTKTAIASLSWKERPICPIGSPYRDALTKHASIIAEAFPNRFLVCDVDCDIQELSSHSAMALTVSSMGELAFACGRKTYKGDVCSDISMLESCDTKEIEPTNSHMDISVEMHRLAKLSYSVDSLKNVAVFAGCIEALVPDFSDPQRNSWSDLKVLQWRYRQLHQTWTWINQVNMIESKYRSRTLQRGLASSINFEGWPMTSGGLAVVGIDQLLVSHKTDQTAQYTESKLQADPILGCSIYVGRGRRLTQIACRWDPDYTVLAGEGSVNSRKRGIALALPALVDECIAESQYEKAAALSVFHGDLKRAANVLQKGSSAVSDGISGRGVAMQLVAMAIAGYTKAPPHSSSSTDYTNLWFEACQDLLRRREITHTTLPRYLHAICTFLCAAMLTSKEKKRQTGSRLDRTSIKNEKHTFGQILADPTLPLRDRIAFAARFLPDGDLQRFVKDRTSEGERRGALEGLMLTGFSERGINLLQCYIDSTGDIQTVALMCARIPGQTDKTHIANRWISGYQSLLNCWQMWEQRALFDVQRAELLQAHRQRDALDDNHTFEVSESDNNTNQNEPPLLYVRCNYCGASLSLATMLRLGASHANWLTRAKPILTCCPSCRKPLPQCSLCLLSFGSLNPYFELANRRARLKTEANAVGGAIDAVQIKGGSTISSFTSELSSIPFVEWITWCQSCRHGHHAHHAAEWFETHSMCPVTDCICECRILDKPISQC